MTNYHFKLILWLKYMETKTTMLWLQLYWICMLTLNWYQHWWIKLGIGAQQYPFWDITVATMTKWFSQQGCLSHFMSGVMCDVGFVISQLKRRLRWLFSWSCAPLRTEVSPRNSIVNCCWTMRCGHETAGRAHLHFFGNFRLLVQNVLQNGLFFIQVSIWTMESNRNKI